jgi:IrrE N-terminal-like domain
VTVKSHVVRILAGLTVEQLDDCREDIRYALEAHWSLAIVAAESMTSRGQGGWCDGMSITSAGVVLYRPTGNRRENFTLAHELGHLLVDNDDACMSWLADQPDPLRTREQVCDGIAAHILIPDTIVDAVLEGEPPNAASIERLHVSTSASWPACVNALADRLPCDGFIAIVDNFDATIYYASRTRSTHPYAWARDSVPAGHMLRKSLRPQKAVSWWPRFNVNERRRYYINIGEAGQFTHAVFAADDLWGIEALHIPQPDQDDRRYDGSISCVSCGYSGRTVLYPCSICRTDTCQQCGECACDRRARTKTERCTHCTVSFLPHLIVDGLCPSCR